MKRKNTIGLALAAALLMAMMVGTAWAQQVTGEVGAEDQSGEGTTVTVPQATISGSSGWVAIHADEDGAPGPVVGAAYIQEGNNQDVEVKLKQPLDSSQQLYAMLHVDDPGDRSYNFPEDSAEDPPVTVDGDVAVQPFQVTLASTGASESASASSEALPESGGAPLGLLAVLALLVSGGAVFALVRRQD